MKANVSEPLMNCRKRIDDIKTRVPLLPWDKSGGCLLIGQVVTGVEVANSGQASAWNVGTCRPSATGRVLERPARGSAPSSGNCEGESTDAGQGGGPSCSSDDAW